MEVKSIKEHGLPDTDKLVGRVAFIFDGCIVSGWPLHNIHIKMPGNNYPVYGMDVWEADSDVGKHGVFAGIEKYVVFDKPVWEL